MPSHSRILVLAAAAALALSRPASPAVIQANPGNYLSLLPTLQPGDTMQLAVGTYTQGLPIWNMNGLPGAPIVIQGPTLQGSATFTGRSCCNTVSIGDSSYVTIRALRLDGLGLAVDAVKAESTATSAHHITLGNLAIVGHGADQQIVGISTKCPTWNWTIRNCVITGAGTGMYLGNSDGSAPFVAGVVEYNLVQDTIGYNVQIKHQIGRPSLPGMPAAARTRVRYNVFSKANGGATGGNARPNLLLGHWPLSGPGSSDVYEVYGNFFYQNPTEALFQGEGNIALYSNLFVQRSGDAIHVQPHYDLPRNVRIFRNTIVATGAGISVTGGAAGTTQLVAANGAFAATPISGGTQRDNLTGSYASSSTRLVNPMGAPGAGLDLYPRVGTMTGPAIATTDLDVYTAWNRDFNVLLHGGTFRGAYAGEGTNPGWLPRLQRRPIPRL